MDLNQKLVSIELTEAVVLRDLFGNDQTLVAFRKIIPQTLEKADYYTF